MNIHQPACWANSLIKPKTIIIRFPLVRKLICLIIPPRAADRLVHHAGELCPICAGSCTFQPYWTICMITHHKKLRYLGKKVSVAGGSGDFHQCVVIWFDSGIISEWYQFRVFILIYLAFALVYQDQSKGSTYEILQFFYAPTKMLIDF